MGLKLWGRQHNNKKFQWQFRNENVNTRFNNRSKGLHVSPILYITDLEIVRFQKFDAIVTRNTSLSVSKMYHFYYFILMAFFIYISDVN
jgi:hypothetical protein